jgi:hypothetical protein
MTFRASLTTAAALAATAVLALPALAAAPATPKGTLTLEVSYLKSGQFVKLYALYGPKFRASCPYAKWVAEAKKAQPDFKNVSIRVTKQTIAGSRALLDYQYVANGKVAAATKGDLFVKIGSGWYDELDKATTC